jgi:hypothetical protein
VLLSTLLQAILNLSHHLLNVLLQLANKLGLKKKYVTLCCTTNKSPIILIRVIAIVVGFTSYNRLLGVGRWPLDAILIS